VGAAIDAALDGRSTPVVLVAAVVSWAAWAIGLLATFVAHPIGLTALRVLAPSMLAATAAAIVAAPAGTVRSVVAVACALVTAALALQGETADRCVDGASYGPEQRVALRIPLPLLAGPLPLALLVIVAGVGAGPLLLAARQWIAGGLLSVFGLAGAALAVHSLHGLSNRFVVLVPAGFVLHDRAALADPVLFPRPSLASVGLAVQGTIATDLTLGTTGLVVEVHLAERLDLPMRTGRRDAAMQPVDAVLFSPVRPGHFLELAAAHRLPVG